MMMDEAAEPMKKTMIRVREFDVARDLRAVEELERRCQVGLSGDQGSDDDPTADHDGGAAKKKKKSRSSKKKKRGMSLYVEQIGDPFARVRHAPDHVMLVIYFTIPQHPPLTPQFRPYASMIEMLIECVLACRLPSTGSKKRSSE